MSRSNPFDAFDIKLVLSPNDVNVGLDDFFGDAFDVDEIFGNNIVFVDDPFVVSIDDVCVVFVEDISLIVVFDEISCDNLINGSRIDVLLDDNVRLESLFVECVAVDDASDIFVDDVEVVLVDGVFRVDVDVDVESLGNVFA